jgi:hypothetical protein
VPPVERERDVVLRARELEARRVPVERARLVAERARLAVPLVRRRLAELLLRLDVPVERRVLRAARRPVPSPPPDSDESSSPLLISFLATPTAAGIATPIAAPAATFFGVDMPSSSFSSLIVSSLLATLSSRSRDWEHVCVFRVTNLRNAGLACEEMDTSAPWH